MNVLQSSVRNLSVCNEQELETGQRFQMLQFRNSDVGVREVNIHYLVDNQSRSQAYSAAMVHIASGCRTRISERGTRTQLFHQGFGESPPLSFCLLASLHPDQANHDKRQTEHQDNYQ